MSDDFWYDKSFDFSLDKFSSESSGIDSFFTEDDPIPEQDAAESTPMDSRIASAQSQGRTRVKVSSPDDLEGFNRLAGTDTLIRMSEQDLWELEEDEDGEYSIERLYKDGEPLKV